MKKSILELVGNTPLIQLNNTNLFVKLEYFNPTGSIKDRAVKKMLLDAQSRGDLLPNSTIIEPTSGNTGIGLAAMGRALGYQVIIVMPNTMSKERQSFIKAFGAQVVLTDGKLGMKGAIQKAKELIARIPNAYMPNQFENASNVFAHYQTTGPEIWEQMNKEIDVLIAGIGTGGTITGCAKYLKEKNPQIKIIGIEPASSPVISKGKSGSHKIEGIGAGFIPKIFDITYIDQIERITDEEAILGLKELVKDYGIFAGLSSGAAYYAAKKCCKTFKDKRIVVILPDSMDRYLSLGLF